MKRHYYLLLALLIIFPLTFFAAVEEDGFQLTSINPADGSVLVGFKKGDSITFSTNADSIFGGFNVEIWDTNTNNIIYSDFTVNKNDENQWVLIIYENLIFLKDHTYQVELTGHEGTSSKSTAMAKMTATYQGNGTSTGEEDDTEFEYSDVTYNFIDPSEGSKFDNPHRLFFVIGFTGDTDIDRKRSVFLDEDSVAHEFEDICQYQEANSQWDFKWQFFIPEELLKKCTSHFKVCIYAKDKGGHVIKGNIGKGLNSHFEFAYLCDYGYPELSVSPGVGQMRNLSKLSFGHKEGVSILDSIQKIILFEEDKTTEVLTINISDLEENESQTLFSFSLLDTLKTEGTYYLHIPERTFALGHKELPNREKWLKYEIVDRLGMYGVTIDPDDGSKLTSLTKIIITFNRWDAVGPYYQNKDTITVTNEKGDTVAFASADYDRDRTIKNQCFIKMKTPVTSTGHYKVNVPANAFILGSDARHMSDSMYFEFDVEEPPLKVPEFAVTTMLDDDYALRHILVEFIEFSNVTFVEKGIYALLTDTEGEEVAKGKILRGRYWYELCITLDDEYHIDKANDFILILPANKILLDGEKYKKDLEIPVHYDPATGIWLASNGSQRVKVYNTQGMLVREGMIDEVFHGLRGVYIVNGRKVVLH